MAMTEQNIHLRDCLKVIQNRWREALATFGAIIILVLLATFAVTPQYEGIAKVLIERADVGDTGGRGRLSYDADFYQTQFQLIKSKAVARRVVDTLSLREDFMQRNEGSSLLKTLLSVKKLFSGGADAAHSAAVPWQDRAAETISSEIKVAPVAESHIVTIRYGSADPVLAAQVANATATAFIEQTLEMKLTASRSAQDWMAQKAKTERISLEQAEKNLQAYMQANNIVTLENRIAVTPEQLSELSTQLVRAESHRKELEALYAKVAGVAGNPRAAETVTAIASDPTLQSLRTQIVESEKQVMELGNKYGPKHPVMVKVEGDLSVLQERRQQEIRRIVQTIRNDYELALANERSLRSQLNMSKSETLHLNEKFIRYNALKREVETIRQSYDALMLKLRDQGVAGEFRPVNLWIVEEAAVPLAPATPRKALNLILGLILALAAGMGVAFLLDYFDNRITDPERTSLLLDAPVLSVIPLCQEQGRHIEGIVLKQPLSAFAENYKTLRNTLLLATPELPARRVIVTSAVMGEGKTSTAANLAITLAQSEKRVVLIDGDLRKPRLHRVFKLDNEAGLSTYLGGGSGKDLVQPGPVANLAVITSGPIPPNPSELIASGRLQSLIEHLSERYDYIICDSPPLLAVADTPVLSRSFDGVILVSRAHQTTHDLATRALKILRDYHIRVLGMVINGMDPRHNDYYYGEYHSQRTTPAVSRALLVSNVFTEKE